MMRALVAAVVPSVRVSALAQEPPIKVPAAGSLRAAPTDAAQAFARNTPCALGAPGFEATPQTRVDRLLDPKVRVGTSTPTADPAGDCAFAMFERIEASGRAGANRLLSEKALQLTGEPNSPAPPKDRHVDGVTVPGGAPAAAGRCVLAKHGGAAP